jgi:hypothetical protein
MVDFGSESVKIMLMLLLMTMIVITSNDMRSMKKVQLHESYS